MKIFSFPSILAATRLTPCVAMVVVASTLFAGCGFLEPPPPDPKPTPVPTPKSGLFDPALYNTAGVDLNKAGDPKLPEYFEVARVYSGNLFWIRSVDTVAAPAGAGQAPAPGAPVPPPGAPVPAAAPAGDAKAGKTATNAPASGLRLSYGAPELVRLAGIAVPYPGQPGAQDSIRTLQNWTLGRKLRVQQDSKYPLDFQKPDLDALRVTQARRVQIFFEGELEKGKKQELNLNRMMVRSGYAVVDQHEPTIFDTKGWLNDEEHARQNRMGLWKLGVVLNRRQPPPPPAKPDAAKAGAGKTAPVVRPGAVPVPAAKAPGAAAAPPVPPPAAKTP